MIIHPDQRIYTERKDELLQSMNKVKVFINAMRGKSYVVDKLADDLYAIEQDLEAVLETGPPKVEPWHFRIVKSGMDRWYVHAIKLKDDCSCKVIANGYLSKDGKVHQSCFDGWYDRFNEAQQAIVLYYGTHAFLGD